MRPLNEKLAADLAEAGKKSFLEKGFRETSLRDIAASLHVTTGAIYRYYTDKEALFDVLVEEPARQLRDKYRKLQMEFADMSLEEQMKELPNISDSQSWMLEYLYDHFDAFKLIACCAEGTSYENYIDTLIEIEDNSGRALVDLMAASGVEVPVIDDELIHILSSSLFHGMFEAIRHDMPREKAMNYMTVLKEFYNAGWMKVLGCEK